jgi:hypothetical protein
MAIGSTSVFGQRLTCYSIRVGETASRLAQRLTGSAHNHRQPWFQIVNPTTATFIPKSHYDDIQSGWHVCVAAEMVRRGSAQPGYYLVSSAPPVLQTGVMRTRAAIDLRVLWWATPLLVAVSGLVIAWTWKSVGERRARADVMRGFGGRFISEFERPLFRKCPGDSPVKSRLRLAPARYRLDILLAPADGRTYPNLFDHKKNVEYDVQRVVRLLRNEPFVSGSLRAEGRWVVIPFRFETDRQQEGVP